MIFFFFPPHVILLTTAENNPLLYVVILACKYLSLVGSCVLWQVIFVNSRSFCIHLRKRIVFFNLFFSPLHLLNLRASYDIHIYSNLRYLNLCLYVCLSLPHCLSLLPSLLLCCVCVWGHAVKKGFLLSQQGIIYSEICAPVSDDQGTLFFEVSRFELVDLSDR